MILYNMSYLQNPSQFKSILLISAAISLVSAPLASAQSNAPYPDVVVNTGPLSGTSPSYSATQDLPALSPDLIAADVEAKFDPLTGRTEYIAQDFDPFEQDAQIAGTVRLRSASSGISRDGASLSGGAYLDVSVLYASESRDPWDGKRLEHAVYMNGKPVDVMTYDIQTLDCKRDITYVTYDDSYYRGASYGYLGGLYRPFPRYRGAGRYDREFDYIRYGGWRGLRNNYYGYRGYDNRIERRRRPGLTERIRDHVLGETDGNNSEISTGRQGRQGRAERERELQRELIMNLRDQQAISSRNVIAPDRLGERRMSNGVSGVDPRPIGSSNSVGLGGSSSSRPATGRISGGGLTSRLARRSEEIERVRNSGARAGVPRLSNATPRLGTATTRQSTPRRMLPVTREAEPRVETRRSSSSSSRATPRNTTRAEPRTRTETRSTSAGSRQTTTNRSSSSNQRSSASRPNTSRSSNRATPPKRSSSNRSSSNRSSSNRSSSSRPTRSVNRSFGGKNKSTPRSRRYYSGGTQTDRYEQSRCIKEERLSFHIPAERLQAARFDGLSIALLDQYGEDIPLYVPPNYIEGFSKANPYLQNYGYGSSGSPSYGYSQPAPYAAPQRQPSGYQTNPVQ